VNRNFRQIVELGKFFFQLACLFVVISGDGEDLLAMNSSAISNDPLLASHRNITQVVGRMQRSGHFVIKERPQCPPQPPVPRWVTKHGVSEAFLNCSQEGSGLYQTRQVLCHRVAGSCNRRSLGEKTA
jgi:hypothetical protein